MEGIHIHDARSSFRNGIDEWGVKKDVGKLSERGEKFDKKKKQVTPKYPEPTKVREMGPASLKGTRKRLNKMGHGRQKIGIGLFPVRFKKWRDFTGEK